MIKPPTIKNRMQQMILLIKKQGPLQLDQARTAEISRYITDRDALAQSLRERFSSLFPERLVASQVQSALQALLVKAAVAVCSLRCEDGQSLGTTAAMEMVLVVGAHAASNGTDNRAIVAAAQELALWLGQQPGVAATPRLMLLMDANCAAAFAKKNVMKGAATQQVFSSFLQSDAELTSCWLKNMSSRRQLLEPRSERASVFSFRFSWQNRLTKTGPGPQ